VGNSFYFRCSFCWFSGRLVGLYRFEGLLDLHCIEHWTDRYCPVALNIGRDYSPYANDLLYIVRQLLCAAATELRVVQSNPAGSVLSSTANEFKNGAYGLKFTADSYLAVSSTATDFPTEFPKSNDEFTVMLWMKLPTTPVAYAGMLGWGVS
jgi:hypothetical protein